MAGISTLQDANKFLQKIYIPDHNARCAVAPADPANLHRPLLPEHRLDRILSLRVPRVVANDFTLRFRNRFFQITKDQPVRVRPKNTVLMEIRLDASTHIRFKDHDLNFTAITKRLRPVPPSDATFLRSLLPSKTPRKPPRSHPWKRASYARMLAQKSIVQQKRNRADKS